MAADEIRWGIEYQGENQKNNGLAGSRLTDSGQWHVGQGRLLSTTLVDQFGATMARWFGVGSSEISQVFPNIGNFAGTYADGYVGFMT